VKEKHVIVRALSANTGTREFFLGYSAPLNTSSLDVSRIPTDMAVEIDEFDRGTIPAVTRHGDVVAVAPAMPIALIQPISVQAAGAPQANIAWGVQAVKADTSPFTGEGVTVAVLDTGIDEQHVAFTGVDLKRENFTNESIQDLNGHGTHCAGTIFGRDVDGMRIGIARGVKKALIGKVLGTRGGSSDQIATAIHWAIENGANVISMSLGLDFPGYVSRLVNAGLPIELATSRALDGYRLNVQLFDRVVALVKTLSSFSNRAVTIVAAAGNESRTDENPDFTIGVSPPAVSEGVISVAALGRDAQGFMIAPFSNRGANVSGPGVEIPSAKPKGGIQLMSGTSMATPHVAGVAALWAEKVASIGQQMNLTTRLVASADTQQLAQPFSPFDVGAGLVQAPQ
jgi:subtilisin family serine protease